MNIVVTDISGLLIIEPSVFEDERGFFFESFNERSFYEQLEFLSLPKPRPFVQDNHSVSRKGVLRGLHYQTTPCAQGKLVRVVQGAAYDVAVDIREGSPTFGRWVGVELSALNKRMFWIPEGFAHGFLALENDTQFLYKATDYYSPRHERNLLWNDLGINIKWPELDVAIIINEKDAGAPCLADFPLVSI
ncbi:dTDP-4-dehydrorhamnose 3,5-epimerase [Pseudomonas sp. GG8]